MKNILFTILILGTLSCTSTFAEETLIPFEYKGKEGFLDQELKVVIPPIYQSVTDFYKDRAIVEIEDSHYAIIDMSGTIVKDLYIDKAYEISNETIRFIKDKTYGFFDLSGNILFFGLEFAGDFSEEAAFIIKDGKALFIDKEGKNIFPSTELSYGSKFDEGLALVWHDKEGSLIDVFFNFIDKEGYFISKNGYDYSYPFQNGLAGAEIDGKFGFISKRGDFVIEPEYYQVFSFTDKYTCVRYKEPEYKGSYYWFWQIIDKDGNIIKVLDEDIVVWSGFHDGFAKVGIETHSEKLMPYGFIDEQGEYLIETVLSDAGIFHMGYAHVVYNGKEGLLDTEGTIHYLDDIMNQ